MIEQLLTSLTFYAEFIENKTGKTGLSPSVTVFKKTSSTPIVSSASASELGKGIYFYTLSGLLVDEEGAYIAVFETTDTGVDQQSISSLWVVGTAGVENLDSPISNIPTTAYTNVSVLSAVNGGNITVYQHSTWTFSLEDNLLSPLQDRENLIFVVKKHGDDADSNAILLVTLAEGLSVLGKTAVATASKGSVVAETQTRVRITIDIDIVASNIASSFEGSYKWWLKAIETGSPVVEGYTLAEGGFIIKTSGTPKIA